MEELKRFQGSTFDASSRRRLIENQDTILELTGKIQELQNEINDHTITECEQSKRDQLLLQEELSEQNRDLRETCIKSLHEMEELKRVQELRVEKFSRRRFIENQNTVDELTARIQELQKEVNLYE